MSTNIYQFLIDQLHHQIASGELPKASWFDTAVDNLKSQVTQSNLADPLKDRANSAITVLIDNKITILGLGQYGLTLILLQISSGKSQEATETYIKALSNPDDLIALMNSGADGVVKAKQHLDAMQAAALELLKEIGFEVAKTLLPFLLALV
jgi:hypothetical protein